MSAAPPPALSARAVAARLAWPFRGLGGNRLALAAFAVLLAVVLVALLAPVISPYDPEGVTTDTLRSPSWSHLFGTDQYGRDILSRIFWGSRLTLLATTTIWLATFGMMCRPMMRLVPAPTSRAAAT
jgi:peptide/nickel transport system permease protein